MIRLTPKQEKFIELVAGGMSQRQAYKETYDCHRMKDKSVDELASKLMKNAKVTSRFNELCAAAVKESEDNTITMRAKLIRGWMKIAEARELDYYHIDDDGDLSVRTDIDNLDGFAIKNVRTNSQGKVIGFDFYDRDRAMDKLQELYGIGAQEDTDNGITVRFSDGMEDMTV